MKTKFFWKRIKLGFLGVICLVGGVYIGYDVIFTGNAVVIADEYLYYLVQSLLGVVALLACGVGVIFIIAGVKE